MNGRKTPSPDAVQHLLREAGLNDDRALLEAVQGIAVLGERPAPKPSPELTQLMANGGRASGALRTKGRITFIGGALAVSMGVGMSGVAAGTAHLQDDFDSSASSISRHAAQGHVDRVTPRPVAGSAVPSTDDDDDVPAPALASDVVVSSQRVDGPPAHSGEVTAPTPSSGVAAPLIPPRQPGISTGVVIGSSGSADGVPPLAHSSTASALQLDDGMAAVPQPSRAGALGADSGSHAGTVRGRPSGSGGSAETLRALERPVASGSPWLPHPPTSFSATHRGAEDTGDAPLDDSSSEVVPLQAQGAAPEDISFFAAASAGEGWSAMFVPEVAELAGDPLTGEHGTADDVLDLPSDLPVESIPAPVSQPEVLDVEVSVEPGSVTEFSAEIPAVESSEALPTPDASPEAPDEQETVGTAAEPNAADAGLAVQHPNDVAR